MALMGAKDTFAATLILSPDSVDLKAEPGQELTVDITMQAPDISSLRLRSTIYTISLDRLSGDIPAYWLDPSQVTVDFARTPSINTTVTFKVADFADPGQYTGELYATIIGPPGLYLAAPVAITITVAGPACQSAPQLKDIAFGPDSVKAQKRKTFEIQSTGTVAAGENCKLEKAWYELKDEYGVFTRQGDLTLDSNGNFDLSIAVDASRKGKDKDGRQYELTIFATNEEGTSSTDTFAVTVSHDQRGKKAKEEKKEKKEKKNK